MRSFADLASLAGVVFTMAWMLLRVAAGWLKKTLKVFMSYQKQGGVVMSVVKVIEVIAESKKSWDDAAENALKEASKSVRNIKSLYVQEMQAVVEDGKIARYRMNAKISFVLD